MNVRALVFSFALAATIAGGAYAADLSPNIKNNAPMSKGTFAQPPEQAIVPKSYLPATGVKPETATSYAGVAAGKKK